MAIYVVSYDLRAPDRDYEDLKARIRHWSGKYLLESVYLVETSAEAEAILADLRTYMHEHDLITVIEARGTWATHVPDDVPAMPLLRKIPL